MDKRPVAVVTGAGRGIGRAIALDLAGAGFDIAGIDLAVETTPDRNGLDTLAAELDGVGAAFLPVEADISRLEDHDRIVTDIENGLGPISTLVNNAGIAPLQRNDVLATTPESFDRVLSVNLRGAFFLSQAVAGRMIAAAAEEAAGEGGERRAERDRRDRRERRDRRYREVRSEESELREDGARRETGERRDRGGGGGFSSIIFITSISAEVSSVNRVEYCVSKAGLSMVASVFADRLAEEGICVYEVRPGIIATDMTAPVKEKYDRLIEGGLVPLGRWGEPGDIARVVTSLARGDLGYATGTVIEASGGMNIRSL